MNNSIIQCCDANGKSEINKLIMSGIIYDREVVRINNVIKFPYNLTDDHIMILTRLFNKYVSVQDCELRTSNHIIASCLNYYANEELRKEASKYKTFFDIGSDLRIECKHHCNLVNNHRDAYRYVLQSLSMRSSDSIRDAIFSGVNTNEFCVNGVQNCDYKSECAISCNSLYDIPIEDMPIIFEKHDINILIAWMFLPQALVNDNLCGINEQVFWTKIVDDDMLFGFVGDLSFIYRHNLIAWRKYMTTTLIKGDKFDIVVEINKSVGPFHKLYFIKTPNYHNRAIERIIPLGDENVELVMIPNMRFVAASDFKVDYNDVPKLIAKRTVAEKLYAFTCKSADNNFSYDRSAAYYQGLVSRITIGNTVVNEESKFEIVDSEDVLFSIITLAAIARLRRTKTLGKIFDKNDKQFEYILGPQNLWDRLFKWADKMFKRRINVNRAKRYNFNKSDDYMMFAFDYFENVVVSDVVDCRRSRCCLPAFAEFKGDSHGSQGGSDGGGSEFVDKGNQTDDPIRGKKYESKYVQPSNSGSTESIPDDLTSICSSVVTVDSSVGSAVCGIGDDVCLMWPNSNNILVDVPGDGNCFYHCLRVAGITHLQPRELRKRFVEFLPQSSVAGVFNEAVIQNLSCFNNCVDSQYYANPFVFLLAAEAFKIRLCIHHDQTHEVYGQFGPAYHLLIQREHMCYISSKGQLNNFDDSDSITTFRSQVDEKCTFVAGLESNIKNYEVMLAARNDLYNRIQIIEGTNNHRCVSKFIDVCREIPVKNKKFELKSILEVSIAPGYVYEYIEKELFDVHHCGINYTGDGALDLNQTLQANNNIVHLNDVMNFNVDTRFSLVYIDACNADKNIDVLSMYAAFKKNVAKHGAIVIKMFYNQINCSFSRINMKHRFFKPKSSLSVNKEVYLIIDKIKDRLKMNYEFIKLNFMLAHYSALNYYLGAVNLDNVVYTRDCIPKVQFVEKQYQLTFQNNKMLSVEFNTKDERYEELHREFVRLASKMNKADVSVRIKIANGVAGAGKSRFICDNFNNNDLILVNTRALKDMYVSKGFKSGCVKTFQAGLVLKSKFRNVFIDEMFEINLAYLYYFVQINTVNGSIYGFGDDRQINKIDFVRCGFGPEHKFGAVECLNKVSARMPVDICRILTKALDYASYTINNKRFSVVFVNSIDDYVKCGDCHIQVLKQDAKLRYQKMYPKHKVNTIHEMKGDTVQNLVWVIETGDYDFLKKSIEHVIVACTRHTDTLVIYDQRGDVKKIILQINDTPIDLCINRLNIPLVETKYHNQAPYLKITTIDNAPIYSDVVCYAEDIIPMLDCLIDFYCDESQFAFVRRFDLPDIDQGYAIVNTTFCDKTEINVEGKCIAGMTVARRYESKDKLLTLATLFGRYGKKTKMYLKNDLFNHYINDLRCGLNQFLKYDVGSDEFNDYFKCDPEEVSKYLVDYLEALNDKKIDLKSMTEIDDICVNTTMRMIKFFMKRQTKFDADFDALKKEKLGQGVNSWDKMMNVAFATYSRMISDKIKLLLKPNCIYSIGVVENEIGDVAAKFMQQFIDKFSRRPVMVENDFTEYDSSQSELTIYFESDILFLACHNPELVELYREHRTNWSTSTPGLVHMRGYAKKHSGEPFTIDFNTILNIAICGAIYDIDDLCCALFKGDDSLIMAGDVRLSELANCKLNEFGMQSKVMSRDVCEFTGFVVTEFGFYPDYVRRFVKAVSKCFVDKKDFEEMQNAIVDYVAVVKSQTCQVNGRKSLCHYYNQIILSRYDVLPTSVRLISENVIEMIESFMVNFKNIKYEQLPDYKASGVIFDGVNEGVVAAVNRS